MEGFLEEVASQLEVGEQSRHMLTVQASPTDGNDLRSSGWPMYSVLAKAGSPGTIVHFGED